MIGKVMTRLEWGNVGERLYESGVDRGVIYFRKYSEQQGYFWGDAVPWNGLISVSENSSGSELQSYYLDGLSYLKHSFSEEFEATVEAFSSPKEFAKCEGVKPVNNGLYVGQQPKEEFGLCYRTGVGNDVDGSKHGYKIHLVYHALLNPIEKEHETISDTIDPSNFIWNLVTKAKVFPGQSRPVAHFVIDSKGLQDGPHGFKQHVENILYGGEGYTASLPEFDYLRNLFENPEDDLES